jgi:hypothetical protein
MARSSPQSFEKRQRERRKQQKREEKFEARLVRSEEKRLAKADPDGAGADETTDEPSNDTQGERDDSADESV